MSKNQAVKLRSKIVGVLLRDARTAARKSMREVAQAIGVSASTIGSYERGVKSPSLPEIEIICMFLSIPFDHFWSSETKAEQPDPAGSLHVEQLLTIRRGIIAASLAKARAQQGFSLTQLSEMTGFPVSRIRAYERAQNPIPLPELEALAAALGLSLKEFQNRKGPVSDWLRQQTAIEGLLELPPELLEFIGKPVNHPYLHLAKKLSDMSVENLRGIAESLLEISL